MTDNLTYFGAQYLADRIRAHWAEQGKFVRVWTEKTVPLSASCSTYIVRSDMINGVPR